MKNLKHNTFRSWFKNIGGSAVMFQAVAPFKPLADTQLGSKLSGIYTSGDLSTYISRMFLFAISIGAIIAVVRLMWAGYLYMGGDLIGNKSKAKEVFSNVIIGLLLLLAIYLILQKINPQLLNLNVLNSVSSAQATGEQAPAAQAAPTCSNCSYCSTSGVCIVPAN